MTRADAPDTHTGPVQVRFNKTHAVVLCPYGHLVTSRKLDRDFAGSSLEAKIAWHQHGASLWVVTCQGAVPKPAPAEAAA